MSYRQSVRLFIPEPDKRGKPWVNEALSLFSGLFGGATAYPAVGSWFGNAGLQTEPVAVVEACEQEPGSLARAMPAVRQLAEKIKTEMAQEAVLYTVSVCESVLV